MENEIRLVNEVKGSVVSDSLLNKVDDLVSANRRIGQLEGELKVAEQLLDQAGIDHERELENAELNVTVNVQEGNANTVRYWGTDPFGALRMTVMQNPNIIGSITTNKRAIAELANEVILAQARVANEEADKKLKEAQKKHEEAVEYVTKNNKERKETMDKLNASIKDKIEEAVKKAELENLNEIDNLTIQLKASQHENDILGDRQNNFQLERDLMIQVLSEEINAYKRKIQLLEDKPKTFKEVIRWRLNSWKLKRLFTKIELS